MDNKQKKKLYKLIYKTAIALILISIAFALYISILALYKNQSTYKWLDIVLVVINTLLVFVLLYDAYKTFKLKNKYGLAKLNFLIVFLSIIGIFILFALNYFGKLVIEITALEIQLIIINEIATMITFVLGLKLSKLNKNTTITIDSVADTPNYDDELMLKKKLNELNRKLEIQKVQEKIEKVEQELDGK